MSDKYTDPYLIEDVIVKRIITTFGKILTNNKDVSGVSYISFDRLDEDKISEEINGSHYAIWGDHLLYNKHINLIIDTCIRTNEYKATIVTSNLYERNELPKLESEWRHILRLTGSQLTTEEIANTIHQMYSHGNFREQMTTILAPVANISDEEVYDTLCRILKEHIPIFETAPIAA